jgi:hypothetical protein
MTTWLKWTGVTTAGCRMREPSPVLLHSAFFAVNMVGIYRWLTL